MRGNRKENRELIIGSQTLTPLNDDWLSMTMTSLFLLSCDTKEEINKLKELRILNYIGLNSIKNNELKPPNKDGAGVLLHCCLSNSISGVWESRILKPLWSNELKKYLF